MNSPLPKYIHILKTRANFGLGVVMWVAISLEEEYIFHRRMNPTFIFDNWDKQDKLPIGLAALFSFLVGWVGCVLCMAQVYFVGPLAKLVGEYGGDMGNYVGFGLAAIFYPPLRYWELKKFGR